MRNLLLFILTIFFVSFYNYKSYSQKKDSLYIKINDLNPNIKRILLDDKGNISIISIRMKNKFKNGFIFGCDPYNTKILTKNKSEINQNNLIPYKVLNSNLDGDFLKISTYYDVFFILTEDKNNYFSIKVMPLLPPELNKM